MYNSQFYQSWMNGEVMIKSPLKYSALLLTLGLFGCGSSSDNKPDPRDALTDIELAKDFTQDFVTVKDAISDMQAPLLASTEQFALDVANVDKNAVEASQNALSKLIMITVNTLQNAVTENGVDYSQLETSYSISTILSECDEPCFQDIDLNTTANVTYANNTLSVTNAQVNSELFEVNAYWEYNSETGNFEYIEERGNSLGEFSSTISFEINLPDPNLEGSNELAIGISNVISQSNDTQFKLELNNFGFNGEIESTSNLTLNDLIELENTDVISGASVSFEISEAQLGMGEVQFVGSASFTIINTEAEGKSNRFVISGEMTNSVGDVIGASIELIETNKEYNSEYTLEDIDGVDYGFKYSDMEYTSYDLEYNLELIFSSQEHGDLSVQLFAIESYISDYLDTYSYSYNNGIGSSMSEYNFSLSDIGEGNILVEVAGQQLNLDYIYNNQESSESDGSSSDDEYEYSYNESINDMIKITDASYESRQVYILFNSEDIYSYEVSNLNPDSTETNENSESTGVYVDDVQYGELEFDLLENTAVMAFTDGDSISIQ